MKHNQTMEQTMESIFDMRRVWDKYWAECQHLHRRARATDRSTTLWEVLMDKAIIQLDLIDNARPHFTALLDKVHAANQEVYTEHKQWMDNIWTDCLNQRHKLREERKAS